jgi:hypothetical protein
MRGSPEYAILASHKMAPDVMQSRRPPRARWIGIRIIPGG